jgi:hypothetical protein
MPPHKAIGVCKTLKNAVGKTCALYGIMLFQLYPFNKEIKKNNRYIL